MEVKVIHNHLLLLLFYTYFLAAWVSNFSFPCFFSQGFPFTDVAKFHFTSTVSPGSILSIVRRNHKEKWKSETILVQKEYPSSERALLSSYGWDCFNSLPCLGFFSKIPKYIQEGPHFFRGVRTYLLKIQMRFWWEQERNIRLLSILTSIASIMFI